MARMIQGLSGAPGKARGQAFILTLGEDPYEARSGMVVVAHLLHPHLAPVLLSAAAIVVEEGALLQHATTLAREFGIPAVVGVTGALRTIAPDEWIEVDGDNGLVFRT